MKREFIASAFVAGALALPAIAFAQHTQPQGSADKSGRARLEQPAPSSEHVQLVNRAAEAYRKLVKESPDAERERLAAEAQCVAVFPGMIQAALVLGGERGKGVASCKGADGKWSNIGFLEMTSASIGAQLGGQKSDMVLFFTNDKAKQALLGGQTNLGADLSATFGGAHAEAGVSSRRDVVAYSDNSGLFANVAALSGTRISGSESTLKDFYSREISLREALTSVDRSQAPDAQRMFLNMLPGAQA